MKKAMLLLLSILMVLSLCACGNASKNAVGEVDKIDINTENASIRYLGYEFVPEGFHIFGRESFDDKTIYLKFEYTNKTETPKNVRKDFEIVVSQEENVLSYPTAWNKEFDTEEFNNYLFNDALNETLSVYYAVQLNNYTPVTISVTTVEEENSITQTMLQEITVPDDVIVPNELEIDAEDLYGDWIDLAKGDILTLEEGKISDTKIKGYANLEYKNASVGVTGKNGLNYTIEGDVITISKERFIITIENEKVFLISQDTDTKYERILDFYRFEDTEVFSYGDTVATDVFEFRLDASDYEEVIDKNEVHAEYFSSDKDGKPDNNQIWIKLSFNMTNAGREELDWRSFRIYPVRLFVVYNGEYTFETGLNFTLKGYNSDQHLIFEGASHGSGVFLLPPLTSEDYDMWIPVSNRLRDDASGSVHLLVLLQNTADSEMFVYKLK